jgi:hypothetical protein
MAIIESQIATYKKEIALGNIGIGIRLGGPLYVLGIMLYFSRLEIIPESRSTAWRATRLASSAKVTLSKPGSME